MPTALVGYQSFEHFALDSHGKEENAVRVFFNE
jgi:hypothetical protein